MGKRGRKRKGYFYEEQEEAVANYITAETKAEKDKIFNNILLPAFTKMIESIIRRYKLYLPDEEFDQTFNDTISFLMTKIEKFDPTKGFKAYSYCGTVCKNYLYYKLNQFKKHQEKQESYDDMYEVIRESGRYSEPEFGEESEEDFLTSLIKNTCSQIRTIIADKEVSPVSEDEEKVGLALLQLFENWDEIFPEMGSNKLNKSMILMYIKDATMQSTTEIRKNMRKYKLAYFDIKKEMLES